MQDLLTVRMSSMVKRLIQKERFTHVSHHINKLLRQRLSVKKRSFIDPRYQELTGFPFSGDRYSESKGIIEEIACQHVLLSHLYPLVCFRAGFCCFSFSFSSFYCCSVISLLCHSGFLCVISVISPRVVYNS